MKSTVKKKQKKVAEPEFTRFTPGEVQKLQQAGWDMYEDNMVAKRTFQHRPLDPVVLGVIRKKGKGKDAFYPYERFKVELIPAASNADGFAYSHFKAILEETEDYKEQWSWQE